MSLWKTNCALVEKEKNCWYWEKEKVDGKMLDYGFKTKALDAGISLSEKKTRMLQKAWKER